MNKPITKAHRTVLDILSKAKTSITSTDLCNRLSVVHIIGEEREALLDDLHTNEMIDRRYEYTGKPGRKPRYISITKAGTAALHKKSPEKIGA